MAGGITVFSACHSPAGKPAVDHLPFTESDEETLRCLAEVIIPATETPGATALQLHVFAITLVRDCYAADEREKYLGGLHAFDTAVNVLYRKRFKDCLETEKAEVLEKMEEDEMGEAVGFFYNKTKSLIIKGYLSSAYVMSELNRYELVPGRFSGYHPVES